MSLGAQLTTSIEQLNKPESNYLPDILALCQHLLEKQTFKTPRTSNKLNLIHKTKASQVKLGGYDLAHLIWAQQQRRSGLAGPPPAVPSLVNLLEAKSTLFEAKTHPRRTSLPTAAIVGRARRRRPRPPHRIATNISRRAATVQPPRTQTSNQSTTTQPPRFSPSLPRWPFVVTVMNNSTNQDVDAGENLPPSANPPAFSDTPNAGTPNPLDSNESQSQASSNLRGKIDHAWRYVALNVVNGKSQYQCLFCLQIFGEGGIHRMNKHLAKISGDVNKCPKVPYDVEKQMETLVKEAQKEKSKRQIIFAEEGEDEVEDAIDEAIAQEEQQCASNQQPSKKEVVGGDSNKKAKIISTMFAPRTTPGS
ncbi:hypothetical protein PIB30_010421 [Stylosanthes scabra]|uniref:BED-type domain-containing protein n=1 Tax=Stylosanthes scabra TaxID=79078 RepID=A0ABU6X3W2_9FABA|nr:hypothetical protein [Stylosanthes scabra]